MKKLLTASLAALALTLAFSAGAEAKCNVTCLNHRVNSLSTALIKAQKKIAAQDQSITGLSQQVSAQSQAISGQQSALSGLNQVSKKVDSLYECLFEVPVTQFGEPEEGEGYLYENSTETFQTTALDVPFEGEFVSAWFLIDGCNTATTASVRAARALAPRVTTLGPPVRPQSRRFP
jgi:uncharacterized coiled-coil protein SlyX